MTGTPASNGTQAKYVDETGNGTQAIATYTFGPLCELSVSGALPTLATLTSFDSYVNNGKVVVEWMTSSEIGTLGFHLYRLDNHTGQYVPVVSRLLPSVVDNSRSAVYRVIDPGAKAGQKNTYMLTEVEARGRARQYGPFAVSPGTHSYAGAITKNFTRESLNVAAVKGLTRWQKIAARKPGLGNQVKIMVREDGIYAIDGASMAGLFGVSAAEVSKMIKNRDLNLTNQGQTVAYLPDAANARLLFYGQAINSNYTDENIYWLTRGKGLAMEQITGSGAQPVPGQSTFAATKHIEENHIDATFQASDPAGNYWYWDYIIGGDSGTTGTYNLLVSGISGTDSATLRINLQGASDTQQLAQFTLKNTGFSGQSNWQGMNSNTITLPIGAGILKEGVNVLQITGAKDSYFFVDSFDVTYKRYYTAQDNSLAFPGGQNSVVTVAGFTGSDARVFDITDPRKPKLIDAVLSNGSIGFKPSSATEQYLAVGSGAVKSVAGAYARNSAANLKNAGNRANYLIITSADFKTAAAALADYRKSRGYSAMTVTVEDIMDEFNYGIYSPEAIKGFLKYAYSNWSLAPQYVVLAGNGSYDYKDYLGLGGQQVPPVMVSSPDGLIPSDNYYVDINDDHIPDIAIGRLPASTVDELTGIISKIIAYENSPNGAWLNKALLAADIPDEGGDFTQDINSMAGIFSAPLVVDKIYHTDYPVASDMNTQLLNRINSGVKYLGYFGHGGVDRLSQDSILTSSDAAAMTNGDKLPVMTAMTCVMGNFAIPGLSSLGEALALNRNGGVAALWTATGLSDDRLALRLGEAFVRKVSDDGNGTQVLGDLVLGAIKKAGFGPDELYMLDMYVILGDPALRIKTSSTGKVKPKKYGTRF